MSISDRTAKLVLYGFSPLITTVNGALVATVPEYSPEHLRIDCTSRTRTSSSYDDMDVYALRDCLAMLAGDTRYDNTEKAVGRYFFDTYVVGIEQSESRQKAKREAVRIIREKLADYLDRVGYRLTCDKGFGILLTREVTSDS